MEEEKCKTKCFGKKNSPRLCFWLGMICGGLIISFTGLTYIGYLYAGGSFTLKQDEINLDLEAYKQAQIEQMTTEIEKDTVENIEVSDYDYILGNKEADVSLFVYTDFECQLCRIYHNNLVSFVEANKDKVNLVVKNFILSQKHPEAYNAAYAATCAGEQGKYYEYIDKLFIKQSELCNDYYTEAVTELELNIDEFNTCRQNKEIASKFNNDYQEGLDLGIRSIPNTVVVYPDDTLELIDGNVSQDFLKSLLKEYL